MNTDDLNPNDDANGVTITHLPNGTIAIDFGDRNIPQKRTPMLNTDDAAVREALIGALRANASIPAIDRASGKDIGETVADAFLAAEKRLTSGQAGPAAKPPRAKRR